MISPVERMKRKKLQQAKEREDELNAAASGTEC
jgi:hypothetical protein